MEKLEERDVLLGAKTTMEDRIVYRFYAQMRDNRLILLCEWDNIEFFESIMEQFEESDHIARFIISYNNIVVNDKVLRPKTKQLIRRKENEGVYKGR